MIERLAALLAAATLVATALLAAGAYAPPAVPAILAGLVLALHRLRRPPPLELDD